MAKRAGLPKKLSLFDTTNLAIGAIVGADIYVASGITAGMIGPFSIFIWIIGGLLAIILALVFAYSSFYLPKVGGPFAYISTAFDKFYGFIGGWSLWIAEIAALAVFPVAFVTYLQYFIPLSFFASIFIKGLFIGGLTAVNIFGVKAAGRFNDVLTLVKLSPLLILTIAGFAFLAMNPSSLHTNYSPLLPFGLNVNNFGSALVLVIWAYAGFELTTMPAKEIKNPRKTIPAAIIIGIVAVAAFYVLINFVVYGVVSWQALSVAKTPLILTGTALMGLAGALLMGIGAMVCVSGTDETGILGTARLSYAMSLDGLFPRIFSKLHPKYKTPYVSLLAQAAIAFFASIYSGISGLITFSIFTMAFSFLLTALALIVLARRSPQKLFGEKIIPVAGVLICLYLLWSTGFYAKIIGMIVILAGIPLFFYFSPKEGMEDANKVFLSEENLLERHLAPRHRFLANFIHIVHRGYRKIREAV